MATNKSYYIEPIVPSQAKPNEMYKVYNNKIKLEYIPDSNFGVWISGLTEQRYGRTITSSQFLVNYDNGVITVDSSLNGTTLTVLLYYAKGMIKIYAQNVALENKNNLYQSDNIEDFAEEIQTQVNNLILSGTDHDPFVVASLTDINNVDYGQNGTQTYLNGRLNAGEQKIASLSADYAKVFVRPENFIVSPENILVDATNAVQRACDYVNANGGTVLLDKIYLIRELTLKSNTSIMGLNKKTCGFKSILNNPTTKNGLLTLYNNTSSHIQLHNLTIDGGLWFQGVYAQTTGVADISGIYFVGNISGEDLHITLSELEVKNCRGHGVYLDGTKESKAYNINVTQVLKTGMNIGCTDSKFTNCTVYFVGRDGYWVGSNNMITGCKAFGTGTMEETGYGDGFVITGSCNSLSSCEAQETGRHGFRLNSSCRSNELSGCIIDSCSRYYEAGEGIGVFIDGAKNNKINVSVANRSILGGNMLQALQINNGSYNNYINITSYTDDTWSHALNYINNDYPIGNKVIVNGIEISKSDFKEFSELNKFDSDYLPLGFYEVITPTNITTSKTFENQAFKMSINTATDWGTYKLARYGKCQAGDNINTLLRGWVSDGTKVFLRTELAFYDSSLILIGSTYTNPSGNPNGKCPEESYYNVVAPTNAAYYIAYATLGQYHATDTGSGYLIYFDARNRTSAFSDIYTKTFDPDSISASGIISTTITVPNARVGKQNVDVTFSNALQGVRLWGEVTATNTVTIYMQNPTASPIDLASGTLKVKLKYI